MSNISVDSSMSLCLLMVLPFLIGCQVWKPAREEGGVRESGLGEGRVITARRADGPIVIDGMLNEDAWERAEVVDRFHTWVGGERRQADHQTEVRVLWDDEYLYIGAVMQDKDVYAHQTDVARTVEDDVFEIFIKPYEDHPHYYEYHVTPLNLQRALFWYDRPNMHAGDALYDAHMRSGVTIEGVLNNYEDKDEGWTVEIAIPFAALAATTTLPGVGTEWRVAFCRYSYSVYLPPEYPRPAARLPPDSPRARELSSSAAFPEPRFHLTDDYDPLRFEE